MLLMLVMIGDYVSVPAVVMFGLYQTIDTFKLHFCWIRN